MTVTNSITHMRDHLQDVGVSHRPVGEWLADLVLKTMEPRYKGIAGDGNRIAVPMPRPDRVASIEVELAMLPGDGPWELRCVEPCVLDAYRDLAPDTFSVYADAYGLDVPEEDSHPAITAIVSIPMVFLNHGSVQVFDRYIRGLESIVWAHVVTGRHREYLDGALYALADALYEAECSYTWTLKAVRFDALPEATRKLYLESAKSALCGRMGGTNSDAIKRALAVPRLTMLHGLDPFVCDTAATYARECLSMLDEERALVVNEQIKARRPS